MSFKEWLIEEMKSRQSKKIHKRWLLMPNKEKPPWKKKTLNTALDNWVYKRNKKKLNGPPQTGWEMD